MSAPHSYRDGGEKASPETVAFAIETLNLDAGARLGIAPLPGRSAAALADLAVLARWRPDLVVSTTTAEEMRRHDIGDLAALLEGFGIAHAHFPIRDFATPEKGGGWDVLAPRLHRRLDGGAAVLVHCLAGRGRSGMVLLRLMVERGEAAPAALRRLRALRPGAVETGAQYEWAAAGRPLRRGGAGGRPGG